MKRQAYKPQPVRRVYIPKPGSDNGGPLASVIENEPTIIFSDHVIESLVLESFESYPDKRGWSNEEEVKNCVLTARRVQGVRLNVDYDHPLNTDSIKHLYPHIALVIQGKKDDNADGRMKIISLKLTIYSNS